LPAGRPDAGDDPNPGVCVEEDERGSAERGNRREGVSGRTVGTLGKRETSRAAFSEHRAMEAAWPTISTAGAMCRLGIEADQLLCDD